MFKFGDGFHFELCLRILELILSCQPRISVEDALKHPFLRQLHKRMDEPVCKVTLDSDFEKSSISMKLLKSLIIEETNKILETEED